MCRLNTLALKAGIEGFKIQETAMFALNNWHISCCFFIKKQKLKQIKCIKYVKWLCDKSQETYIVMVEAVGDNKRTKNDKRNHTIVWDNNNAMCVVIENN